MHHVKMRVGVLALAVGLMGVAAMLFSMFYTSHSAEATTPVGPWKLIGQLTITKKGPTTDPGFICPPPKPDSKDCHQVIQGTIAGPPGKLALLVKGTHVIIMSNPPDPMQDHPVSWRVVSFKAGTVNLERVGANQCALPAPPPIPAPGTRELWTGPCQKPIVPGAGNATDLSGVSDIIVDNGVPATTDLFHCISRTDIDAGGNAKSSAVCADNGGTLANAQAEPLNDKPGFGPDGLIGPPPPPPYAVAPPSKGAGTYAGDNLTVTTCFPDVGASVNIIAVLTIPGAHAQLVATGKLTGTVQIYGVTLLGSVPQTNANCNALTPAGPAPAALGVTVYPAADIAACPAGNCIQSPFRGVPDTDFDNDGCTDSDELWQIKPGMVTKCADDPWNGLEPAGNAAIPDLSGTYSLTAIAKRQDVGNPGFYYDCQADINQTGKSLTARVLCYIDTPTITVNTQAAGGNTTCPPAPAERCGDGISGAPPPGNSVGTYPTNARNFADVDDKQTVLTGTYDNVQKVMKLSGCFEDRDGEGPLGDVYVDAVINAFTGHGMVNIWIVQTNANCLAGTPVGAGPPIKVFVPLHIAKQQPKAAPPAGADSDVDGCPNKRELSDTANQGGLRDTLNHYDYFNPTGDGVNRVDDILAVVNQYFMDDPPGTPDMKSPTDRTAIIGGNPWNLGPPNGQQRVDDILAIVKQYFHDC